MPRHGLPTREELFELVWTKPTRQVAAELGMSDVALGKICRQLLESRFLEGLSYIEIKDKYSIPLGTVTSRLSRCQENLKKMADHAARKGGVNA